MQKENKKSQYKGFFLNTDSQCNLCLSFTFFCYCLLFAKTALLSDAECKGRELFVM